MYTIQTKYKDKVYIEKRETAKLALRCGISSYKEHNGLAVVKYFKDNVEKTYNEMRELMDKESNTKKG